MKESSCYSDSEHFNEVPFAVCKLTPQTDVSGTKLIDLIINILSRYEKIVRLLFSVAFLIYLKQVARHERTQVVQASYVTGLLGSF